MYMVRMSDVRRICGAGKRRAALIVLVLVVEGVPRRLRRIRSLPRPEPHASRGGALQGGLLYGFAASASRARFAAGHV